MIVLIAKLERGICLIVYFGFQSYFVDFANSTMTIINKIYLQVLVQLLRRENLICSFIWIFKLAMSAVCGSQTLLTGGEGTFGKQASTL